jgi:predicted nuclease of predicted toxin-antitoxin system
MKLLLDECVTRYLKREFAGHEVQTVDEAGLKGLKNGELLRAASEIFDVLITVDKNISHQQNVRDLKIAILVLVAKKNSIEALAPLVPQALNILPQLARGEIAQIGS